MRPPALRLTAPPDVADLMCLAATDNPFLSREDIVAREVVTERIGLLVAERFSASTLLYLWTHTIDDLSPWMAHAAQWLERYPAWRTAHALAPAAAPVRMVLAAPGVGPTVGSALRLVAGPVTLSRYVYGELGGRAVLGWETGTEVSRQLLNGTIPLEPHPAGDGKPFVPDDLTPEEVAFFLKG